MNSNIFSDFLNLTPVTKDVSNPQASIGRNSRSVYEAGTGADILNKLYTGEKHTLDRARVIAGREQLEPLLANLKNHLGEESFCQEYTHIYSHVPHTPTRRRYNEFMAMMQRPVDKKFPPLRLPTSPSLSSVGACLEKWILRRVREIDSTSNLDDLISLMIDAEGVFNLPHPAVLEVCVRIVALSVDIGEDGQAKQYLVEFWERGGRFFCKSSIPKYSEKMSLSERGHVISSVYNLVAINPTDKAYNHKVDMASLITNLDQAQMLIVSSLEASERPENAAILNQVLMARDNCHSNLLSAGLMLGLDELGEPRNAAWGRELAQLLRKLPFGSNERREGERKLAIARGPYGDEREHARRWLRLFQTIPEVLNAGKTAPTIAVAALNDLKCAFEHVKGQERVCERAINMLLASASASCAKNRRMSVLHLSGPPGVGKNLIAEAIASNAGRPIRRILGTALNEFNIQGVGAHIRDPKPGIFVEALLGCELAPVIFIDEVGKASACAQSRLLSLLEPATAGAITDDFFPGLTFDFSDCIFILSSNTEDDIERAFSSRVARIEMAPLTKAAKSAIAKQEMKRILTEIDLHNVTLSDLVIEYVVERWHHVEGCREIKHDVNAILLQAFKEIQYYAVNRQRFEVAVAGAQYFLENSMAVEFLSTQASPIKQILTVQFGRSPDRVAFIDVAAGGRVWSLAVTEQGISLKLKTGLEFSGHVALMIGKEDSSSAIFNINTVKNMAAGKSRIDLVPTLPESEFWLSSSYRSEVDGSMQCVFAFVEGKSFGKLDELKEKMRGANCRPLISKSIFRPKPPEQCL